MFFKKSIFDLFPYHIRDADMLMIGRDNVHSGQFLVCKQTK